jgi:hypothetical protein
LFRAVHLCLAGLIVACEKAGMEGRCLAIRAILLLVLGDG